MRRRPHCGERSDRVNDRFWADSGARRYPGAPRCVVHERRISRLDCALALDSGLEVRFCRSDVRMTGPRSDPLGAISQLRGEARMKTLLLMGALFLTYSSIGAAEDTARPVRVAFVISENFTMIDFAGPWEVFADTSRPGTSAKGGPAYELYTVAASSMPVHSEGEASLVPKFTFETTPRPDLIIIGAQSDRSPQVIAWLRQQYGDGVTIASICVGADQLARTGLLDGHQATTHHDYIEAFRKRFPGVQWLEGRRFVESAPRLYTAGGLTSGIDLALYLVSERYGRSSAIKTAQLMEYRSDGWKATVAP
jgi:putative intracellular protease/amidase